MASPDYLCRHGTPNQLSDLAAHQCLTGTVGLWRFMQHGKLLTYRPQGRLLCNSGVALRDAALQGLGLVQLPDYYVADYLAAAKLCSVLDNFRQPDEGIWALYPQNRHLSAKVRRLVDFLAEQLQPVSTMN